MTLPTTGRGLVVFRRRRISLTFFNTGKQVISTKNLENNLSYSYLRFQGHGIGEPKINSAKT